MERTLNLSMIQMSMGSESGTNLQNAIRLVRAAAASGSALVVLPELFLGPYFCKDLDPINFARAISYPANPLFEQLSDLACELGIVLVASFFEQTNNAFFNSAAIFDKHGEDLGIYRKSHIPDGPGYQEKYYFSPGNTGFKVFDTGDFCLGVGICWDQWFPEAARCMTLQGAEIIVYPTAIGSEPHAPSCDSSAHWKRVMIGHAAANIVPIAAANRTGIEHGSSCDITFYGNSFICGPTGETLAQATLDEEIVTTSVNLSEAQRLRQSWGLFRDRRPDLYGRILTLGD